MKYFLSFVLIVLVLGWFGVWIGGPASEQGNRTGAELAATEIYPASPFPERVPEPADTATVADSGADPQPTPAVELPETVMQEVPFTPQAPSGQWGDPVFQNACEEASLLMAAAWALSRTSLASKSEVEQEIRAISALAEKRFGDQAYDTSIDDTTVLYREYFGLDALSVLHDISLDDLRKSIQEGNIVVVAVNGQKLANPRYTPPGPEHHMLVIIGYDAATREFVTNDPGTRFGASYRYDEDVLFDAISDYPTGYHLPFPSPARKSAIVVLRNDSPKEGN